MTRYLCCVVGLLGVGLSCRGAAVPAERAPGENAAESAASKEPAMTSNAKTTDDGASLDRVGSADGKQRRARLRRLVDIRAPTARDELSAAAADPDPLVRAEVAYQVAKIRHPQGLAILDRLSADPAPVVRAAVVEALAVLGDHAAQAIVLRFAVDDESDVVRGEAVRALDGIDGPDAERALEKLAHDPVPTVRDRAAETLARHRAH
jgi:HEAT repeat protein